MRELFKNLPTTYSYFKTEAECERQIPAQYSLKLMNLASFPLEIWKVPLPSYGSVPHMSTILSTCRITLAHARNDYMYEKLHSP